jgi:uncharacterized phage protein gp47/JayE
MTRTATEISQSIRSQLAVLDPDISAEPLTPERKIIDTVAEVIAGTEVDQYVLSYQYDIDTRTGADLDKMVALFGFARQGGRRASGFVTFQRATPATADIQIPAGTQISKPGSSISATVTFVTLTSATMFTGTVSVDVPVEATVDGEIGNVPANSIIQFGTGTTGDISSITNADATSGGSSQETDAELRVRFKNTVFRNISGTTDQYLALAVASRFASKANVVGPTSRFIEYLQISGGAATSQIPYSKYTYAFDYWLTDGAIANETFYNPRSVDYTFTAAVPPTLAVNNSAVLPNNTVVLLEHSYCSINSRNDPTNNIANYVDVFVAGQDATTATESANFPTSANNFNATSSSAFYQGNFRRVTTNVQPTVGNRFQELLWQPVATLPSQITIGANTFNLNTDYWLVKDVTVYKGSKRARNGIEWTAAAATTIGSGTSFSYTYTFNKLAMTLNELMDSHKQITTDVLVHIATSRYFNIYLTVMYTPGFASAAVNQAITTVLSDFFSKQQFGAVIQISDLLEITHEVPGVDNVRLTQATEATSYGVLEVAANGVTPIGAAYISDFSLQDSDLPVLNTLVTIQRSQNTWSS